MLIAAAALCTITALCSQPKLFGQFRLDTVNGLVGKELALSMIVDKEQGVPQGNELTLSGSIKLQRPTVFYPQAVRGGAGVTIDEYSLTRLTDSTYDFAVRFGLDHELLPNDTLFTFAGEALAGSDTLSLIYFSNLLLNGERLPDQTGKVRVTSIGSNSRYIRFATLDPGRPNPTKTGLTVRWGFRIDKKSDVTFKIYDMLGQEVWVDELGELDQGTYVNTFTPDWFFPSGMFVVRMITNSGEALEIMHVLR